MIMSKWDFLQINISSMIKKSKIMNHIVFVILMISRNFLSLSYNNFKEFSIFSAVMLSLFNWVRFLVIIGQINSSIGYFLTTIVYSLAFFNGIIRLSIIIGNNIDLRENILYGLDDIPEGFKTILNTSRQWFSQSPLNNAPKTSTLHRYGLVAGIITFPIFVYSVYELRCTRIATQISADAAVKAADATVRAADANEVAAGLRSKEDFYKKHKQ